MNTNNVEVKDANTQLDEFINTVGQTPEANIPPIPEPEPAKVDEPVKVETEPEAGDKTVPEGFVPIPVHAELRAKARDKEESLRQQLETARINEARLQGRLEAIAEAAEKQKAAQQQVKEEESPLEKFAKEYPEESPPARVLIEQRQWDAQRASVQEAQGRTQTLEQQVKTSIETAKVEFSAEKIGEGLDLDSVVGLARQSNLISQSDQDYAASQGIKAAQTLYNLSLHKIRQAGGVPLQELNRRIIARRTVLAKPNNEPKQPNTNLPTNTDDKDRADVSGITDFMFRN